MNRSLSRVIDLGTLLTVTTGKIVTQIAELQNFLEWFFQTGIPTHELGSRSKNARHILLREYPQLNLADLKTEFQDLEDMLENIRHRPEKCTETVTKWLQPLIREYGKEFLITRPQ